jgi:hypothetical protein
MFTGFQLAVLGPLEFFAQGHMASNAGQSTALDGNFNLGAHLWVSNRNTDGRTRASPANGYLVWMTPGTGVCLWACVCACVYFLRINEVCFQLLLRHDRMHNRNTHRMQGNGERRDESQTHQISAWSATSTSGIQ